MENSNLENMQCIHKAIGDQKVGWYVVMDKETSMDYGLFELRIKPKSVEDPTHASHMRLVVSEGIGEEADKENYDPLADFCHYCFHAVLALTEEEGLIECRIRPEDDLILDTYRIYKDVLNEEEGYELSSHKRWIIIQKK